MDLLQEAKHSNKQAFNELVSKYNHIFYKTSRIYFFTDDDIYKVLEKSLSQAFKKLSEVNSEKDFLCLTLKILIQNCQNLKRKFDKNINKKINSKLLTVSINDTISSVETSIGSEEYQAYRRSSVVEEYITSIEEEYRITALLYYYANLSIPEISKVIKLSENDITKQIDSVRIKIYEIIKNKEVDL